ncbi:MAG: hypothetical protein AB8G99_10445 [Planctomycetaceae bacterium]
MTIRYKCEECGVSMKIKDDLAGRNGKCPKCKHSFIIPPPESEVPADDVPDSDAEPGEAEDDFDDDDDLPDMPLEVTPAPTMAPSEPPPPAPKPASRGRKEASETKKATRMSSRPKPGKKKAKSGEFDPADFLMGDDDGPSTSSSSSRPAPAAMEPPRPPRGRVGGLDDDNDSGPAPAKSSMSDMFRDFVPAGGVKRESSGVASTSAAADALARRAEEKRGQSNNAVGFDIPDQQAEEGTDYVQIAKDIWGQFGLYIGGFLVVLIGVYLLTSSMFSSGSDIPDLYTVRGYVSKDGVPVAGAELFFNPADTSREAMAGNNNGGHAVTDAEGYYEFQYLKGEWGLPAGRYTVQVLKGGIPFAKATTKDVKEETNDLNFQY